ncbi:uncharacterized protein LACBIDRAFT_314176 [Laccaria bicolor S238N-H82]|uniref:Predicted protein n=1 Tax=Laccaria bicolor (strain S238N-H82 / ATCC MYA-4686) TaxID=486041 RepID=B0D1R8_LACBS|nr:uncharacterized protein LACBIDRAFT_314176 [Laccaria bicolor S238N-H82]EDR12041.1 predicted protein [Laccaria bicolor S238N-H82]|eukprot:XP_001877938.1 predicted protein [Laccaria bicolor S238N-H82]
MKHIWGCGTMHSGRNIVECFNAYSLSSKLIQQKFDKRRGTYRYLFSYPLRAGHRDSLPALPNRHLHCGIYTPVVIV